MEATRPQNLQKLISAKQIQKIFDLAFKIQTKGIANVFFGFQAHVAQVDLRIFMGGWCSGAECETLNFYVSEERFNKERIEAIIDNLRELYNSEVSYEQIQEERKLKEIERKRQQYEKLKAEFEPSTQSL